MKTPDEWAQHYVKAGLSVIPIKPDESKSPCGPWKRYQEHIPTEDELVRYFDNGFCPGIGIVGGAVSGGLEILDIEGIDEFPAVKDWGPLVSLSGGAELLEKLVVVSTPSGGMHYYYRCPGAVEGNQKLAQCLGANGSQQVLIETRREGGYVLAPGSPAACHPTRRPYTLDRGSMKDIPTISAEERELLLNCAKALTEVVKPRRTYTSSNSAPSDALRPGDDYTAKTTWSDVLGPHRWVRVYEDSGGATHWRRPGKETGTSASTDYDDSDKLYVFSTNASPFDAEHSCDRLAAHTFLNWGGDFTAAARALGKKGYGAAEPPMSAARAPGEHKRQIWGMPSGSLIGTRTRSGTSSSGAGLSGMASVGVQTTLVLLNAWQKKRFCRYTKKPTRPTNNMSVRNLLSMWSGRSRDPEFGK